MAELFNNTFRLTLNDDGALTGLRLLEDPFGANFVLSTEEEPWVPAGKQWGLGFITAGFERLQITGCAGVTCKRNVVTSRYELCLPQSRFGCVWDGDIEKSYVSYPLELIVTRTLHDDFIEESFRIINHSQRYAILDEIGLYSSFHDTYCSGENALDTHVNQHIWTGGDHSYIEAQRQSGKAPHMGLITTKGCFTAYHIEEKNTSNFRGVVALVAKDVRIRAGAEWRASRRLVTFRDRADFEAQICRITGYPRLDYGHLVAVQGEPFRFHILDRGLLNKVVIDGIPMEEENGYLTCTIPNPGEYSGKVYYGDNKVANLRVRVIAPINGLLRKRAHFIVENLQINDPENPRYGAYMPYDNIHRKIMLPEDVEDLYHCYPDRNEARERMGIGAFLAAYARIFGDTSVLPSLDRYAAFIEKYIVDENYDIWDSFERQSAVRYYEKMSPLDNSAQDMRFRNYNYVLALEFFSAMYWLTKDVHYAQLCAGVMTRFAEKYGMKRAPAMFGADTNAIKVIRDAGLTEQADSLLAYLKDWICHLKDIDDRYDPSEVAYEQGICATAFRELADYYLYCNDDSILEILHNSKNRTCAFEGDQPDYRCYHTPIRHWDGFWFGGLELWGDTFPHYWSCISADSYCKYAKITGQQKYADMALDIFRNNFALIEPDGSCWNCFMYPEKINGRPAGRLDPWSNDQDWAFYIYLLNYDLWNEA